MKKGLLIGLIVGTFLSGIGVVVVLKVVPGLRTGDGQPESEKGDMGATTVGATSRPYSTIYPSSRYPQSLVDFAEGVFRVVRVNREGPVRQLVTVMPNDVLDNMLMLEDDYERPSEFCHMTKQKRLAMLSSKSAKKRGLDERAEWLRRDVFKNILDLSGGSSSRPSRPATRPSSVDGRPPMEIYQRIRRTVNRRSTFAEVLTELYCYEFLWRVSQLRNSGERLGVDWGRAKFSGCLYSSKGRLYVIISQGSRKYYFRVEAFQLSSGWLLYSSELSLLKPFREELFLN